MCDRVLERSKMAEDMSIIVPIEPQATVVWNKRTRSSSWRWILLDGAGQFSLLEMDKYDIMHRVQIHARDFRILDPLLSYPSKILVRENAIILNLEHVKGIITAKEVLLRDPTDENVVPVVEELKRRLPRENSIHQHDAEVAEEYESPLEFRALEVALESICSFLAARTTELEMAAYPALDELTSKISILNLDKVRKLKISMSRLNARVQKVRHELEQLLDDDDDVADLCLSRKLAGSSSPVSGSSVANWLATSPVIGSKISRASVATVRLDHENDVEELHMLLEDYFLRIDGTLNKLITLREYIDDTEDYINIQLDNHRNKLIQLELVLNTGTLALNFSCLVTAIFGTNIPISWNQNESVFKWIVIVTTAISVLIFLAIIACARKKGLLGS